MNAAHLIALRTAPAFADLDAELIAALGQVCEERYLARGAALDPAAASFVLEGRVRAAGTAIEHGPVGVLEALAGVDLDARADSSVHVLVVSGAAIRDLLEEHFRFLAATLQALARWLLHELAALPPEAWPQ